MFIPNTYKSHKLTTMGAVITLDQGEKLDCYDLEKLEGLITLLGGFNPLFNDKFTLTTEDHLKLEDLQQDFDSIVNKASVLLCNLSPRS